MTQPTINSELFNQRCSFLFNSWKDSEQDWGVADAIVVLYRKNDEKTTPKFHLSLTELMFPSTIIAFTKSKIFLVASEKKARFFRSVDVNTKLGVPLIEPIVYSPDEKSVSNAIDQLFSLIEQEGNEKSKIGLLQEDNQTADALLDRFHTSLQEKEKLQTVDISVGVSKFFAINPIIALKNIERSSQVSVLVLQKYLIRSIEKVIENETKTSQRKIAQEIQALFENPGAIHKKLDGEDVESGMLPIVQSGGDYNLDPFAVPSDSDLQPDTIIVGVGTKFSGYHSFLVRTMFVDNPPILEAAFEALLKASEESLKHFKPGSRLCDIYEAAKKTFAAQSLQTSLTSYFLDNLGFPIGLLASDSFFAITADNQQIVQAGMTFHFRLGLTKFLVDGKYHAILFSDIIHVGEEGPRVLTEKFSKDFNDFCYSVSKDDENEKIEEKLEELTANTTKRARNQLEEKRRQHQKELREKNQRLQMEVAASSSSSSSIKSDQSTSNKVIKSYPNPRDFPSVSDPSQIITNEARSTVLFPIYGSLVPFHASVIHKVEKASDHTIRVTFVTPQSGKNVTINQQAVENPASVFISELNYQFESEERRNDIFLQLRDLEKKVKQKEAEALVASAIIKQQSLVLSSRPIRLKNVFIRPNISNRRSVGTLEAHTNGFRFISTKGEKIDILYNNIQFSFFQLPEKETIILVHFRLIFEILVGKKSSKDIQFCQEASELSTSVTQTRRHTSEYDEYYEEELEMKMRAKLIQEFKTFCGEVEKATDDLVSFEVPKIEEGFYGNTGKSNVLIQPTANCLVHLIETPFFVQPIKEIRVISLERVEFRLRYFDMVIVFKDFKKPATSITNIESSSLDKICSWLDSHDIEYYKRTTNINWKFVMKEINADPEKFAQETGFSFLKGSESSSDEEDNEDEIEGSDFDQESEDSVEEESDEDSLEYNSEDDEASDDGDDEEDDDDDEDDDSDGEGLSWDEMEEKAKREDQKARRNRLDKGEEFSSDEENSSRPKRPAAKAPPRRPAAAPVTTTTVRRQTAAPAGRPVMRPSSTPAGRRPVGSQLSAPKQQTAIRPSQGFKKK